MGNGFDLELSLRLGSHGYETSSTDSESESTQSSRVLGQHTNTKRNLQQQQEEEEVTFVYNNGRFCGCDATEMQAKAIIGMAKREMEEGFLTKRDNEVASASSSSSQRSQRLIGPGLSIKRSLQQFVEKRRTRINASSPYNLVIRT